MANQVEHTETPWQARLQPEYILDHIATSGGTPIAQLFGGMTAGQSAANAHYIVKCVNNHEALVEACEAMARFLYTKAGDDKLVPDSEYTKWKAVYNKGFEVLANIEKEAYNEWYKLRRHLPNVRKQYGLLLELEAIRLSNGSMYALWFQLLDRRGTDDT